MSHTFPAAHMDRFVAKINAANARLDRTELTERFTFTVDYTLDVNETTMTAVKMATVDVSAPMITSGEWTFVASINSEEAGVLVHCAPGQTMPEGFDRPDTQRCDHCNVNRERKQSYVIVNSVTGEAKQVGSSCIELFLGVSVKGLWTLEYTDSQIAEMFEDQGLIPREAQLLHRDSVITVALAVTNMGKGFVSRSKALENQTPSSDIVSAVFFPSNKDDEQRFSREMRAAAAEISDETLEAVKLAAVEMKDSEYRDNLMVAVESEYITHRSFGTLVSIVSVYQRALGWKAEREAAGTVAGFLGEEKDKLADLKATVVSIMEIPGYYSTSTLFTFRTEGGQVAKWFSTNPPEIETGDSVIIKGTVKAQEVYNGQDQTLLTRCKLVKA